MCVLFKAIETDFLVLKKARIEKKTKKKTSYLKRRVRVKNGTVTITRRTDTHSWLGNRAQKQQQQLFTGKKGWFDDDDGARWSLTRRTRRSACSRSGPDSADQTGCTASETGCGPGVGALEEPAYWKRCGPAAAPPGCTSGTVPAKRTPPTAGRCLPGRRKCPAAAATPRASFPAACSSSAGAADRPALPTTTTSCPWACSWRGHEAERPPPLPLLLLRPPSCSGSLRQQQRPTMTRTTTRACTRTIPACDRRRSATMRTKAEPTTSACPAGGIRTRQTPWAPAWARAACGSSSTGDTRSGPWPAGASSATDPRAVRT